MANDKTKTSAPSLGIEDISILLDTLEKHDVTEFELEREGEKLSLKRGPQHVAPVQNYQNYQMPAYQGQYSAQAPYPAAPFHTGSSDQVNTGEVLPNLTVVPGTASSNKNIKEIRSPMVGTFYRRPAVDAESYVNTGDPVKKGDVLCIIEAMKLMNEIESEFSGKITEICLEDGQMVEYGEILFKVEVA